MVQAEGQEEADRLIACKLVKPTTDQYGRHVWVYSQELASDERRQGMQTAVKMRMDVDAKTAASISTAMLRDGTGGADWGPEASTGKLRKGGKGGGGKPVSDEMKAFKTRKQHLKQTKAAIAKSKMNAMTWKTKLAKSSHAFAKKTMNQLAMDISKLEKFQLKVEDFDTKFVFDCESYEKMCKTCDEHIEYASGCVDKADKNIELAKVL